MFDPHLFLAPEDYVLFRDLLPFKGRFVADYEPDLTIGENGVPYLHRWHLIPRMKVGNLYLHIQVGSDPQRPLHDHPWDNMTNILRGGYDEIWEPLPWLHVGYGTPRATTRQLRQGDVVFRKAGEAHRLLLPEGTPYTMTLFFTGPVVREWGFWFKDGWRSSDEVLRMNYGMSAFTEEASHDNTE
jgi:hypothetical protein